MALPGGVLGTVIFVILALVGLYYLYQFLFSSSGFDRKDYVNGPQAANMAAPIIVGADKLPALYEGGEYTANIWVYINDWSYRRGQNKHILSVGGDDFLTFAIFLAPYANTLNVCVHTKSGNGGGTSGAPSQAPPSPSASADDLSKANLANIFAGTQTPDGLTSSVRPCDIPSFELQKWVQVTVVLNNATSDIYVDGKLARSCVLPSTFKVDKNNLQLKICAYNGFGGFISNTSLFNYSLNPEEVWRLYMSGPSASYSVWRYVKSLYDPNVTIGTVGYPKQNLIAW
jgi:hypothetical protein